MRCVDSSSRMLMRMIMATPYTAVTKLLLRQQLHCTAGVGASIRTIYKPHIDLRWGFCPVLKTSASGPSISRILSGKIHCLCDHLSGRCVAAPLGAAYPELTSSPCVEVHMKTSSLPSSADDFVPAWPCSRRGLPGHLHYCRCRWSFTPPFHHHPGGIPPALFVSVALVRQVSSSRRVPRPGCYPTPCSMECGLSSIPTTQDRDRPTDLRREYDTRRESRRQHWDRPSNKD